MNGEGSTKLYAVGLTVPGTGIAPGSDAHCTPIEVTSHTYRGYDLTDSSGSAIASYPEPHPDVPDDRNGTEGHPLSGGLPFIVSQAGARLRDSNETCAVGGPSPHTVGIGSSILVTLPRRQERLIHWYLQRDTRDSHGVPVCSKRLLAGRHRIRGTTVEWPPAQEA